MAPYYYGGARWTSLAHGLFHWPFMIGHHMADIDDQLRSYNRLMCPGFCHLSYGITLLISVKTPKSPSSCLVMLWYIISSTEPDFIEDTKVSKLLLSYAVVYYKFH